MYAIPVSHRDATYDVVIVGARVAGASTALLLARAGLDVLVVDRAPFGSDTLSTHALMRGGVIQLNRWGLLPRVVEAGTPPIRHVHFDSDGDELDITIKPSNGVDSLYAPRRTVIDPILVTAASEAGAEFRFETSMSGLAVDDRARVVGIHTVDRGGVRRRISARLVVGADGVRSQVAHLVNAPLEREGVGALSFVYGHWYADDADRYEWFHRRTGCAGVIPTNGDTAGVFAAAEPSRVRRGGQRVFDSILAEAAPAVLRRLSGQRPVAGFRLHRARPGFIRRSWGPGWALVGDAGYWKDPIGSHGMTQALRDAELLADAVTSAIDDPGALVASLADYQSTRDRLSRPTFDATDTIARLQWRPGEISDLLRQLNSAMATEVDAMAAFDATLTA
jgi:2-polyprenyl-6-methoxyphenol hydroxylase-like FAD-dependent oxidoreductase